MLVVRIGDFDEFAVEIPGDDGAGEGADLSRKAGRFSNGNGLLVAAKGKRK